MNIFTFIVEKILIDTLYYLSQTKKPDDYINKRIQGFMVERLNFDESEKRN